MILTELKKRAEQKSPLCVGIDLRQDHLPEEIRQSNESLEDQLVEYAKEAVDASVEHAACYKVQIACYEALGLQGMRAYARILKYIRSRGEIVIADIKRGDIGSTAQMYAKGHFEGDFEADILTLNPYMGKDAIFPYFEYFKKGKGAFILGKTSNPSSVDFQDLELWENEGSKLTPYVGTLVTSAFSDWKLYMKVLKSIGQWNMDFGTDIEQYPMGAVVGVNEIGDIPTIRKWSDELFLLVPGYGAQGAREEDIRALIGEHHNGVVNVSRGYTAGITGDYRKELKERAGQLAMELRRCFE